MYIVTGGAGFIGSNFIHWFNREKSSRVLCLDALTYSGSKANLEGFINPSRFEFVRGDICDAQLVSNLLKTHRPSVVVHFAAESHVDRSISSPSEFLQTNVNGTFNLLKCAQDYFDAGNPIRFVHISTDEVFGSLKMTDMAFTENTPYAPNSPYSASKAAADHFVRAFHHTYGLPTLTLNCSNNYGPRQHTEKLLPTMIEAALAEKPLPIYGDGNNVRDWLFVEDFCRAIALVAEQGRPGESYNVGGASERTNLEIIKSLCDILDTLSPRKSRESYWNLKSFIKDRPGHDFRYAVNFNKIQRELGWTPQETLETGLKKTVQWYLSKNS